MKKSPPIFRALKQLLVKGTLDDPKVRGREMAFFKRLRASYPSMDFWLQLKPTIPLTSIGYFLTDYGAKSLQQEWSVYQIGEAQRKAEKLASLDGDITRLEQEAASAIPLDTPPKTHTVNRKQNALEWADSP